MAVIVNTNTASALLERVRSAIEEGKVDTWSYDEDGDFTHTPEQWANKAWLRPKVSGERLFFYILPPKNVKISKATYGVYHGRFSEMLLTHFDNMFSNVYSTALPIKGDVVAPR